MANTGFYNNLDLKYPEVGIALQRIDRMKPGKVAFSIPVLTPTMNNDKATTNKVIQTDKSKILNDNKDALDVSNIEISNAIMIEIPVELCALPSAYYDVTGHLNADEDNGTNGTISMRGNITISGSGNTDGSLRFNGGSISGSCSIGGPLSGPNFSGSGRVQGSTSLNGTCSISGTITSCASRGQIRVRNTNGTIGLKLSAKSRYIEKGSKWLIVFIGGDAACPAVLCRLPDSAAVPVTEATLGEHMQYEDVDANFGVDPFPDRELPEFDVPEYQPFPDDDDDDEKD